MNGFRFWSIKKSYKTRALYSAGRVKRVKNTAECGKVNGTGGAKEGEKKETKKKKKNLSSGDAARIIASSL